MITRTEVVTSLTAWGIGAMIQGMENHGWQVRQVILAMDPGNSAVFDGLVVYEREAPEA